MAALTQAEDGLWRPSRDGDAEPTAYRLCANYTDQDVCNWAVPGADPISLCQSCRLTSTIPDLATPGSREAWAKLETAKRRVVYALQNLGLPLRGKSTDPQRGLEFRFLSDAINAYGDRSRVLTGHDNGVITINVAESDDVYREHQRLSHHEPYRTLLGHFRHETGHYYWDYLISQSDRLHEFRRIFGDETADYQVALQRHYNEGPPPNWSDNFISAYSTMHPWEDWAESWAHVMHMVDALDTAHFLGLTVTPLREGEPVLAADLALSQTLVGDFEHLIDEWSALTYVLNNLTRGLGLADAYPFILSKTIVEKLRFVCNTIALTGRPAAPAT